MNDVFTSKQKIKIHKLKIIYYYIYINNISNILKLYFKYIKKIYKDINLYYIELYKKLINCFIIYIINNKYNIFLNKRKKNIYFLKNKIKIFLYIKNKIYYLKKY